MTVILFIYAGIVYPQGQQRSMPGSGSGAGKITGILTDSQTSQPIGYGSVVLFRAKDSIMVNGSISNDKGNFTIDKVPFGKYFLKVTFVGYSTARVNNITVAPKNSDVELKEIKLKPSSVSTQEVVITSERDMIVNNLDKKVINVDKNIASAGGTAVDVMQTVPSVTVDANGGVSLRGNSNVTILIDGKPSGLAGVSSSDVLSQIPASSIESIEVVTNPSAKYDPEGTSGIINIVMKKKSIQGINGIASLNAGSGDRYNGSINLNYRRDSFNFFGSYDTRFGNMNNTGASDRISTMGGFTSYLDQNSINKNRMIFQNFNLGTDYYLNDFNTLTFSVQHRNINGEGHSSNDNRNLDSANTLTRLFTRVNDSDRKIKTFDYTLSYKKTFDTKSQELTADIIYSNNKMGRGEDIRQKDFGNGSSFSSNLQHANSDMKNDMMIIQSNYVQPYGENGRIELGWKSNLRKSTSNYDYYNYNDLESAWIANLLLKNYYEYNEKIHAVYGIFSGVFAGIKYQAGLRAEQVYATSKLELTNESFDNNYFSLYPTLHLVQEFSDEQELALSYSRRVDRPNGRQLNPFVDYSDSLNIVYGNPKLKPQYINSYELGYSKVWEKSSFSSSLFYRQTDGIISNISSINEAGVTKTTFENLNNGISYGVEVIGSKPIADWWKLNANFTYFKSIIHGGEAGNDLNSESYSWTGKLNNNFSLGNNFSLQLMANYRAPVVMIQGKMKEMYFADVAMRKDLLEGKLALTLRVSDLFNTMKFNSESFGTGFFTNSTNKMNSRAVYLGVSYKINNYNQQKEKPKQTDSSVEDF